MTFHVSLHGFAHVNPIGSSLSKGVRAHPFTNFSVMGPGKIFFKNFLKENHIF